MMLGERSHHLSPTVQVPPWPTYDDPTATNGVSVSFPVSGVNSPRNGGDLSPYLLGDAALNALRRFLPSNDSDDAVDAYSCDEFRIYEFKVRRCARGRSHDWTECPYAHPGEKARRRDPRKYHYSGTACPDFRKGNCKRGDACEFAHGVFECWLHPARYRTQPCKDGVNCRRRVCFFAHTPEQLRVLSPVAQQSPRTGSSVESYDGSPLRLDPFLVSGMLAAAGAGASPPVSPPSESPPVSPSGVNDLLVSFRKLQMGKGSLGGSWVGSPHGVVGFGMMGSGFGSPSRMGGFGSGGVGLWEEPVERVESGRVLRAKRAEKLSKENCMESSEDSPGGVDPDVDWVSELVM